VSKLGGADSLIRKTAEGILGQPLTDRNGMNISEVMNIEDSLCVSLPPVLRDFYLLVGNTSMFMSSFNRFIKPLLAKDEMLVFLEEYQSVCYWAIKVQSDEDNVVYQCSDIETESPEWCSEDIALENFLALIMYYQCAQGGYEHCSAVYRRDFDNDEEYSEFLTEVTADYKKVVEHNGLVIYQQGTKLIWHFTDKEGKPQDIIYVSTLTEEQSEEFDEYGFAAL
jgi:hypothetical protein